MGYDGARTEAERNRPGPTPRRRIMTSPLGISDFTPAEREQYAALCERMDGDEALEWIAAERDADRRDGAGGVRDRRGAVASARDGAGRDVVARPEPLKPALRALIRIVARSAMRPKLPRASVVPQNPQSR